MGRLLVTLGTDGVTDWVKLPDGQSFNLGPVSVLSFLTKLTSLNAAQRSLKEYMASGETMVPVDSERMWEILAPRKSRLATEGSFMPNLEKNTCPWPEHRKGTIMGIERELDRLEAHLKTLASKKSVSDFDTLRSLATLPSPRDYPSFYGLPVPKGHLVEASELENLADTHRSNALVAEGILKKIEATADQIDQLVREGKKFNASRARRDLYEVSSKVASIAEANVTAFWVREDLEKLASRAEELHQLFCPRRV